MHWKPRRGFIGLFTGDVSSLGVTERDYWDRCASCPLNVGVSRVGHIRCLSHREGVPNCRISVGHIEDVEGG